MSKNTCIFFLMLPFFVFLPSKGMRDSEPIKENDESRRLRTITVTPPTNSRISFDVSRRGSTVAIGIEQKEKSKEKRESLVKSSEHSTESDDDFEDPESFEESKDFEETDISKDLAHEISIKKEPQKRGSFLQKRKKESRENSNTNSKNLEEFDIPKKKGSILHYRNKDTQQSQINENNKQQNFWYQRLNTHITELNHPLSACGLLITHLIFDVEKHIKNISYSTQEKREKMAKLITEALLANVFNTVLPIMHSSIKGQNGWAFIVSYLLTHLLGKEGLEALTANTAKTEIGNKISHKFDSLPPTTQMKIISVFQVLGTITNFIAAYVIASLAN